MENLIQFFKKYHLFIIATALIGVWGFLFYAFQNTYIDPSVSAYQFNPFTQKLDKVNDAGVSTTTINNWSALQNFNGGLTFTNATGTNFTISSFTAGSIPFILTGGTFSEDNNNLYWDSTNARLGVGSAPNLTLIPTMSSNNAPAPYVVTASSSATVGFDPYKAFDNNASTYWDSAGGGPHWIKIDMGTSTTVNEYRMSGYPSYSPKTWVFEGSTSGSFAGEQVTLDTRTGESNFSAGETREYTFTGGSYRYFRWYITASQNAAALDVYYLQLGNTNAGHVIPTSKLHISASAASNKGLIIQSVSGQSADLLEIQDSSSNILSYFNSSGQFVSTVTTTLATTTISNLQMPFSNGGTSPVTINKSCGKVTMAALATTAIVTTSLMSANALVFFDAASNPGVNTGFYYTTSTGKFTINADVAVSNNTVFSWCIITGI